MFFHRIKQKKQQRETQFILESYVIATEKNLRKEGWHFDILLFWERVDFVIRDERVSLQEAYDKCADQASVPLRPTKEVLEAYKKDTSFRDVLLF